MSKKNLQLIDMALLNEELAQSNGCIPIYKNAINSAQEKLFELFNDGVAVEELLHTRSQFVDKLLKNVWQNNFDEQQSSEIALIAVGGYGRGELHPYSDIDILLLIEEGTLSKNKDALEMFITQLWDIGLEIGSSVRTLKECAEVAADDITIATNIVESRYITGAESLFSDLNDSTQPDKIWPSKRFFKQKWDEQKQRHLKNHDTAYNLEPNIKEGPGGLRDIQMIGWVTKRHFGDNCLKDLVTRDFLTDAELTDLESAQSFLWKVRFALHYICGRREDRLLFEHQRKIADLLGFKKEPEKNSRLPEKNYETLEPKIKEHKQLGVELFMKQYYRTLKELSLINEMLLQDYQETILYDDDESETVALNSRFQICKNFIEVSHPEIFIKYPFALLEIFLLIQQNSQIKGVRASTIRLIRMHLHLIDDDFRDDIRCKSLFIEIFKQPRGLTHTLRQMNTYGVLAAYLPCFENITGQMQFDLYHIYTVDQHTIFVIRNMRRFFVEKFSHEFPLCSQIIRNLPKPELLYLAGLFHDIGKGRGGDHSKLGAVDAREFCLSHGLSIHDAELVAWLVSKHLLMSSTAQHRDISDPDIINEFAAEIGNGIKLDYLYLLTVADMRATNNTVWNSWKDSLLKSLRRQTIYAFQRGLSNPINTEDLVKETQTQVISSIETKGWNIDNVRNLWTKFGDDYFVKYSPEEITRHTQALLLSTEKTVVHIESEGASGGTDIFIHTDIGNNLFINTTHALNQLHLNIVEAKLISSVDRRSLNTYTVLELNGDTVTNASRLSEIHDHILDSLSDTFSVDDLTNQKAHRRIECFFKPSEINFVDDEEKKQTMMIVSSTDRTGLLSKIAFALRDNKIRINNAKITTLGAQVEDAFLIRDGLKNDCISDQKKESLKSQLTELLDF